MKGAINSEFLNEMQKSINFGYRSRIREAIKGLHEVDVAELITVLSHEQRSIFMTLVGKQLPAAVFVELDDHIRREIVEYVDINKLVTTVQELDSDDAVFVLEDLAEAEKKEVLEKIPATDRASIERAFEFPEQSAGRLTQAEFVAVPPYWTVGQTIDYLRLSHDLTFDFHDILLVDPRHTPIGIVHLSKL
ncbi:MAG: magnesium transporter, partial [Pseudomonadota bacterium]|nr:magnesium transporter [Pseudomonadota bacterium]